MASTLRQLLVQRAARLQERPALTAPGWGTLSYSALRNRVEGVALGLLSKPCPPGTSFHVSAPGPWAWAAELAMACCGLAWEPAGAEMDPAILGGARFNSEEGRGPYHTREDAVHGGLPFHAGLSQGEVLQRLVRLNGRLGWDHESAVPLPLASMSAPEARALLWSALYAGAHVRLTEGPPPPRRWFHRGPEDEPLDLAPFRGFWGG